MTGRVVCERLRWKDSEQGENGQRVQRLGYVTLQHIPSFVTSSVFPVSWQLEYLSHPLPKSLVSSPPILQHRKPVMNYIILYSSLSRIGLSVNVAGRRALVGEEKLAATNWRDNDVLQQNSLPASNMPGFHACFISQQYLQIFQQGSRAREKEGEAERKREGEEEACSRAARLLPPQCLRGQEREPIWREVEASLSAIRRQGRVMVVGGACDKTCGVSGSARRAWIEEENVHFTRPGEAVGACDRGLLSSWTVRPKET